VKIYQVLNIINLSAISSADHYSTQLNIK